MTEELEEITKELKGAKSNTSRVYRAQFIFGLHEMEEQSHSPLNITIAPPFVEADSPLTLTEFTCKTDSVHTVDLKERVERLLRAEPKLDQMDIAERLEITLELAARLCSELVREGRIRSA